MNHLKWNIGCFGKGEKRKVRNRTRFTNCSDNCALGSAHVRLILLLVFSFLLVCYRAAAAAKSHQSCPTLCDPIDSSPPGSPVPGLLQARTLEWVAISFSNAWKWKVKVKSLSVWLFKTPWTAAYQAPPSMGFFQARGLEWVPLPSLMLQGSFLVFLLFPLQPDLPGRISCSIFSSPRSLGSFGGLCLGHGECS